MIRTKQHVFKQRRIHILYKYITNESLRVIQLYIHYERLRAKIITRNMQHGIIIH